MLHVVANNIYICSKKQTKYHIQWNSVVSKFRGLKENFDLTDASTHPYVFWLPVYSVLYTWSLLRINVYYLFVRFMYVWLVVIKLQVKRNINILMLTFQTSLQNIHFFEFDKWSSMSSCHEDDDVFKQKSTSQTISAPTKQLQLALTED